MAPAELLEELTGLVAGYLDGGPAEPVLADEAMAAAEQLVALTHDPDHPDELPQPIVNVLAWLRFCRYLAGSAEADLAAAMVGFGALAVHDPELVPGEFLADCLAERSTALLGDAQQSPDRELLDHAIRALEAMTQLTPAEHFDRAGRLANLCLGLRLRSERYTGAADIQRAVGVGALAVREAAADAPERVTCLLSYADALQSRFELLGDPEDLDQAILAHQQAVHSGQSYEAAALLWSGVGGALLSRFLLFGQEADLAAAAEACSTGADAAEAGGPYFAATRTNLASVLALRGIHTGSTADLDRAISALRDAIEATPPGHPQLALRQSNLAATLHTRYVRHHDRDDLSQAIAAAGIPVSAAEDDPYLAMYLSNLGYMLWVRGEDFGGPDDVEAAVAVTTEAVRITPPDHAAYPGRAFNLGVALLSHYDLAADPADLDRALAHLEQACRQADPTDPHLGIYRSTLAAARLRRRTDADLTLALHEAQAALAALPDGHPHRAAAGLALGLVHEAHTSDPDHLALATQHWRAAVAETVSPADKRLAAARAWADLSVRSGQWREAVTAYEHVIALVPLTAWRGIGRADRERLLTAHPGTASDATAAALADNAVADGLRLVEMGRSVLWNLQLELRADLTGLRAVAPELADELDEVRAALEPGQALALRL